MKDDLLEIFLDYEIRSSWWADLVWWKWGQKLTGSYFACKVKKKYKRYLNSKKQEKRLKEKYNLY